MNETVDAVVVGSGAGGGVVASLLARAGMKTVIMEMGEWTSQQSDSENFLAGQRSCILTQGPGRDGSYTKAWQKWDNGRNNVVVPNSAAVVGGGTVTYGAMAWRYMKEDFRLKSTYGEVEGGELYDWPISYDDLEPYYERAEYEIGVSGDNTGNPFAAPRKKPFPMPAFPYTKQDLLVRDAVLKLGLHPFMCPALRNSVPYNGRPACLHQRSCVGYACPIDAKNGSANTVIPKALKTGNCELRTNAMVSRILTDGSGKATGVEWFDADRGRHVTLAKVIVLAAASTGTARILLLSKSAKHPNGFSNSNNLVGAYSHGHWYVEATGYMDESLYTSDGPGVGVAINDFTHHIDGLVGGGTLHTDFSWLPYQFANGKVRGWGIAHKREVREKFGRLVRVCGPIEEIPMRDGRCVLDDKKRDYFGIPLVSSLGTPRCPNDAKIAFFMAQQAARILEAMGAKEVTQPRRESYLRQSSIGSAGGQHQCGTCRMGNDPATSVADSWGRLHEADNVYVADGALQPNMGAFNPVLTIMACAYRVGDGIVNQWRHGK